MAAKLPMMATGTADMQISTLRQFCRNTSTTTPTRTAASNSGQPHPDRLADERRGVVGGVEIDALRKMAAELGHLRLPTRFRDVQGVGAGQLEMAMPTDG